MMAMNRGTVVNALTFTGTTFAPITDYKCPGTPSPVFAQMYDKLADLFQNVFVLLRFNVVPLTGYTRYVIDVEGRCARCVRGNLVSNLRLSPADAPPQNHSLWKSLELVVFAKISRHIKPLQPPIRISPS